MSKQPVNFRTLLEQVNNIRVAIGIGEGKLPELPKGVQGSPSQCVLAQALSNGWRATVSDRITLYAPAKIVKTFDFNSAAKALRQLGFREVEIVNDDGRTETKHEEREARLYDRAKRYGYTPRRKPIPWKPVAIDFKPSKTMANFIDRYDDGDFPELVLGGN